MTSHRIKLNTHILVAGIVLAFMLFLGSMRLQPLYTIIYNIFNDPVSAGIAGMFAFAVILKFAY